MGWPLLTFEVCFALSELFALATSLLCIVQLCLGSCLFPQFKSYKPRCHMISLDLVFHGVKIGFSPCNGHIRRCLASEAHLPLVEDRLGVRMPGDQQIKAQLAMQILVPFSLPMWRQQALFRRKPVAFSLKKYQFVIILA